MTPVGVTIRSRRPREACAKIRVLVWTKLPMVTLQTPHTHAHRHISNIIAGTVLHVQPLLRTGMAWSHDAPPPSLWILRSGAEEVRAEGVGSTPRCCVLYAQGLQRGLTCPSPCVLPPGRRSKLRRPRVLLHHCGGGGGGGGGAAQSFP